VNVALQLVPPREVSTSSASPTRLPASLDRDRGRKVRFRGRALFEHS